MVMARLIGRFNTSIDPSHLLRHRLKVTGCFLSAVMGDLGPRELIVELLCDCTVRNFTVPINATFTVSHHQVETSRRFGRVIRTM